jgi:Xaa-Pro aminopeptidase
MDTRTAPARLRIARLREVMAANRVDAVLVPSSDPHLSEYLPGRWQGREWFSGFTGSMGTLVVTIGEAALFADSRYWTQAETELQGSGISLVKIPTSAATHHVEWIAEHLKKGQALAVDGQVLGLAAAQQLRAMCDRAGIRLLTDVDLLESAWVDRPGLPTGTVYEHAAPQAAVSRPAKLALLREAMARLGATHHFVSTVDDRLDHQPARGRRRIQPGLPGPPAGQPPRCHAFRRCREGRR